MKSDEPLDFGHRPALDFTPRPSKFAGAALLVSCTRCGRLFSTANSLAFNPVCPECASPPLDPLAPLDSPELRGSYALTDPSIDATFTREDDVLAHVQSSYVLNDAPGLWPEEWIDTQLIGC